MALFSTCTSSELRRLARLGTRLRMASGRHLVMAGRGGAEVLMVVKGSASCVVSGTEVARFGAGDFFGEIAALDGGPRTATVVATSDMEVLVFTAREFEDLVKTSPEVAHKVLRVMARRLRHADARAVA
jgi:CRP-like cAMP-binding protein